MAKSSIEIMDRGMKSLIRELGIVEAEYFITFLKQDRFDYTKWRQTQFDDMSVKEISDAAAAYEHDHPFNGKATRV